MSHHNILIIGGGFAGVKCAQELSKKNLSEGTTIRLVSDREHFEYHGALYRVAAGNTPLEVCFPLREIIDTDKVDIIHDSIVSIDKDHNHARGESGSTYRYDTLVIALGSQTIYFGIPGLRENAHGMKSIERAISLKNHITQTIGHCAHLGDQSDNSDQAKICGSNFVVVGGGATGVEVAGEVMQYARMLTTLHGGDPSLVNVELVEAQSRLLGLMPESFAKKMQRRLEDLGVDVMLDTAITAGEAEGVLLKGKHMESKIAAKTVIWTAGVRAHQLIEDAGFELTRGKKAVVCHHMRAKGHHNVFVAGDAASTKYSGMAQTALYDASYLAQAIQRDLAGQKPQMYKPRDVLYAVPAGPGWAGATIGRVQLYGQIGWWIRRLLDLVVFVKIAPLPSAFRAFMAHYGKDQVCSSCHQSEKST